MICKRKSAIQWTAGNISRSSCTNVTRTWEQTLARCRVKADAQAQNVIAPYFISVVDASRNGDWTKADEALTKIQEYQKLGVKMYFQMRAK